MNTFERASFAPAQVAAPQLAAEAPRSLARIPEYATYRSIVTGVPFYDAPATVAGLDMVLGTRITRLLLTIDAETTLHVAAQVFADHAREGRHAQPKDLQAGLFVNVVKEMAQVSDQHAARHYAYVEDVLRRCSLEPGFKLTLKEVLFDQNAIASCFIVHVAA